MTFVAAAIAHFFVAPPEPEDSAISKGVSGHWLLNPLVQLGVAALAQEDHVVTAKADNLQLVDVTVAALLTSELLLGAGVPHSLVSRRSEVLHHGLIRRSQ